MREQEQNLEIFSSSIIKLIIKHIKIFLMRVHLNSFDVHEKTLKTL